MSFRDPPASAAWEHTDVRTGFEVVFLAARGTDLKATGSTAALEGEEAWAVHYSIALAGRWTTRSVHASSLTSSGRREVQLEADGAGGWRVDGERAPHLDGCLDADLESSCLTNAFPVHRLALDVGQAAKAPAAFVRALDLRVERLEQRYERLEDVGGRQRYSYAAPAFDFECELAYDESGLLVAYPGIGRRIG